MPIPEFELDADATNDVVLREYFLTYTRNLLDHIVTNAVDEDNEIATLFTVESANFMKNAWEEVLPLFEAWTGNMRHINPGAIILHGLGGAQLRFKLANVAWWSQQVNLATENNQTGQWIAYIERLLDSIDTLLDSILAASGGGSALKEMKDSIKNAINILN